MASGFHHASLQPLFPRPARGPFHAPHLRPSPFYPSRERARHSDMAPVRVAGKRDASATATGRHAEPDGFRSKLDRWFRQLPEPSTYRNVLNLPNEPASKTIPHTCNFMETLMLLYTICHDCKFYDALWKLPFSPSATSSSPAPTVPEPVQWRAEDWGCEQKLAEQMVRGA